MSFPRAPQGNGYSGLYFVSPKRRHHYTRVLALLIDLDNDSESHCQGRPTRATLYILSITKSCVPMPFLLSRSMRRRAVVAWLLGVCTPSVSG